MNLRDFISRNNVAISGSGKQTIVFSHGFGCDSQAWQDVSPGFEDEYRTVLFDHVGAGGSDLRHYNFTKYDHLRGYAADLIEILQAIDTMPVVYVGHSVGAMIGMLAAIEAPRLFSRLVMLCASPCYTNEEGYIGGFSKADLDELLEVIDSNFLGWSRAIAPSIMGNADRPELADSLGASFCRTDPDIARHFARVTFLSDHRADLPKCNTPTLVMQTRADMIAPEHIGHYIVDRMPNARLAMMRATGHCPHISAPSETLSTIRRFLASR